MNRWAQTKVSKYIMGISKKKSINKTMWPYKAPYFLRTVFKVNIKRRPNKNIYV